MCKVHRQHVQNRQLRPRAIAAQVVLLTALVAIAGIACSFNNALLKKYSKNVFCTQVILVEDVYIKVLMVLNWLKS